MSAAPQPGLPDIEPNPSEVEAAAARPKRQRKPKAPEGEGGAAPAAAERPATPATPATPAKKKKKKSGPSGGRKSKGELEMRAQLRQLSRLIIDGGTYALKKQPVPLGGTYEVAPGKQVTIPDPVATWSDALYDVLDDMGVIGDSSPTARLIMASMPIVIAVVMSPRAKTDEEKEALKPIYAAQFAAVLGVG